MLKSFLSALMILSSLTTYAQTATKPPITMKLNAGIVTPRLKQTKAFYSEVLGFGITFENDFYLLMHTPNHQAELSFLLPNHPTQQPLFQQPFSGKGLYLTIEVDRVAELYQQLKRKGVAIKIDLRKEPWGDEHFAIEDPNGIGIDLVQYAPPQKK